MRILFVHPNYRSGGAEIAGTWPPAWVAYLTGPLRRAGFDDIHFIDAMTEGLSDDELRQRMGHAGTRAILADAQIERLPSGRHMIPEVELVAADCTCRVLFAEEAHVPRRSYTITRGAGQVITPAATARCSSA